MADGSSGLSLSEMGLSTVKKTSQMIKKVASPAMQQIKQQIGGQNVLIKVDQQSNTNSLLSTQDSTSLLNEPMQQTSNSQHKSTQASPTDQNTLSKQQMSQNDQQQIELLRKKLHNIYFEDFSKKAEGNDQRKFQEEQQKLQLEKETEVQKQRDHEQRLEPIAMSQSPQKGMGKKVKKSIMNLLKPKQGSHEGSSSKG